MPYATLSDVRRRAPNLNIDGTTKPSANNVESYIAEANEQVDATLAALGYTTPLVGGPRSLLLLRQIVTEGALAKTLDAIVAGRGTDNDIGQDRVWKRFQGWMDGLTKGTLQLPDEEGTDPLVPPDQLLGFSSNIPEILAEEETDLDGNPLISRYTRF